MLATITFCLIDVQILIPRKSKKGSQSAKSEQNRYKMDMLTKAYDDARNLRKIIQCQFSELHRVIGLTDKMTRGVNLSALTAPTIAHEQ